MGNIWLQILTAINHVSTVLQARKSTIDVEVKNLSTFLDQLKYIRLTWPSILNESKMMTANQGIDVNFKRTRTSKKRNNTDMASIQMAVLPF